jgi:predicted DNA-binding antitoxin AbrB/MazE fold protein
LPPVPDPRDPGICRALIKHPLTGTRFTLFYSNIQRFKSFTHPRRGEACRSFIVRVKYEKGVLKPLESLEFPEGEELLVRIIDLEERIRRLQKYKGVLVSVDEELLEETIEDAEQL